MFNFRLNKEFICDVIWSENEKYVGKIIYNSDEKFVLTIHSTNFLDDKDFVRDQLFLSSFDDDNKKYCITLKNCRGTVETIGGGYFHI